MENATKALLIAAAVLIAIVIVALGVNLLSSTGNTTQKSEQVGEELKDAIGTVTSDLEDDLKFDLKRLYDKLGKRYPGSIDKFSKQLERVYLCKYEGNVNQYTSEMEYQIEAHINNTVTSKNQYFSIIPVELTTNDIYNKIKKISDDGRQIGISTINKNYTDSEGKYKILVMVVVTGVEH